jgi:hypothetical protein
MPAQVAWGRHDGGRRWSGWSTLVAKAHGVAGAGLLTSLEITMAGMPHVSLGSVGGPRGEGASRGPERNYNGRPQCNDCVRMVHVIKEVNQAVLSAVAQLRKDLASGAPKLGRGRPSTKAAKQAARRKKRIEGKVGELFEHRYLFVQKRLSPS